MFSGGIESEDSRKTAEKFRGRHYEQEFPLAFIATLNMLVVLRENQQKQPFEDVLQNKRS